MGSFRHYPKFLLWGLTGESPGALTQTFVFSHTGPPENVRRLSRVQCMSDSVLKKRPSKVFKEHHGVWYGGGEIRRRLAAPDVWPLKEESVKQLWGCSDRFSWSDRLTTVIPPGAAAFRKVIWISLSHCGHSWRDTVREVHAQTHQLTSL